jgi:hypothetical protein
VRIVLRERIVRADPDLAVDRIDEFLAEENRAKSRQLILDGIEQRAQRVQRARAAGHPLTLAVAINDLARAKMGLELFDETYDRDEVVRLAEESVAIAPALSTRATLTVALVNRAMHEVAKDQPALAEVIKSQRLLGPVMVLGIALHQPGVVREALLASADVRRAAEQLRQLSQSVPTSTQAWGWKVVQAVDPAQAEPLAAAIRAHSLGRSLNDVNVLLAPSSAATVLDYYWTLQLLGKQAEADQLAAEYAEKNEPLPLGSP